MYSNIKALNAYGHDLALSIHEDLLQHFYPYDHHSFFDSGYALPATLEQQILLNLLSVCGWVLESYLV